MTSSTDGTPAHTAQTQICQQRKFKEDIDWVYFEKDSVLSPEQVEQKVQALRQAGTPRQDTVEATGLPCPCNS
jgi:hypothetical protein